MKDNLESQFILRLSSNIGLIFYTIQLINSIFYQKNSQVAIRLPIAESYGNSAIYIQLIIGIIIYYFLTTSTFNQSLKCFLVWFICFINSIYLKLNEHHYYNSTFLLIIFILTLLSLASFYLLDYRKSR